ncbi:MAG TPA: type II toxin-antitoxin system VapC family toxin [Candidatus Kapabacteria bacterium]|nr:type II toxin-antitoxin system VapC family toxin [Candidatus Kapabacteria bacterium]
MSKKTGPLAFDAFPLLVLFLKQTGWERVREVLRAASLNGFSHVMSLINVGEVYYTLLRDHGESLAEEVLSQLSTFPIEIIVPSYHQMIRAGHFKASGGLSYADCYAAALAVDRDIPVLTGDPEFSVVEQKGVKIEWLPPNR